ncbi:SEC-C domain-containing protein [Nitratireductor luteus]|uniref:SEC-C domain-containing protein n=1 Tax=Nitratireductor luteus TaxID=2976980 RepID=UPI00223F75A1|nr:SEC-C domain-containing protein [Nitratireductor luteus]
MSREHPVDDMAACPCNSGKRFGACHGHYFKYVDLLSPTPNRLNFLAQNGILREALPQGEKRRFGYGRPLETWQQGNTRFVRVNGKAYASKNWRTFTDFLFSFLTIALGRDWWTTERSKLLHQQHPILRQFKLFTDAQRASTPDQRGLYSVSPSGPMMALVALAYDLYLCAHNEQIPPQLVERLKNPFGYEGALYEAHVIGIFARAGYRIEFEDEGDVGRSHCEFTAINKGTGKRFSVEAKAVSSRSGRAGDSAHPPRFRGKLHDALKKHADHERMVFIELNRAIRRDSSGSPEWGNELFAQMSAAENDLTVESQPAPCAFVYVTNRPFLIGEGNTTAHYEVGGWGFKIPEFPPERLGRVLDMHRARMKHLEAYQVFRAMQQLQTIPPSFTRDPFVLLMQALEVESERGPGPWHPLDAFDFLFHTYHRSSRENLVGWLSDYHEAEHLAKLSQLELAEVYCAGMVPAIINPGR